MFYIFEYVILVFPKHSNFGGGGFKIIREEIMQIENNRRIVKIQEILEGLQMGGILLTKY